MSSLRKAVLFVLIFGGLALIGALAPQPGHAGPTAQSVLITNTATQPVPMNGTVAATQSGTWNVGVTGVSGAITANQGGAWNVGILGTPSVNIANTRVPTADAERLARIPYESTVRMTTCSGAGTACIFQFSAPPSGYRLVAENLSGYFQLDPSTTSPVVGYLEDSGGGSFKIRTAFTAPLGQLSVANAMQAAFNQPTKFYFDVGEGVPTAVASSKWLNGFPGEITLTGYLENCTVTGCPPVQP